MFIKLDNHPYNEKKTVLWERYGSPEHFFNYYTYPKCVDKGADDKFESLTKRYGKEKWEEHFNRFGLKVKGDMYYDNTLKRLYNIIREIIVEHNILEYSYTGYKVSAPRYIQGHPKCMKQQKHKDTNVKGLNIFFINEYASTFGLNNVYFTLALFAIIKGLEVEGKYKINLFASTFTDFDDSDYSHLTSVLIKTPSKRLSLYEHGAWLLLNSMFRIVTKVTRESSAPKKYWPMWTGNESKLTHTYTPFRGTYFNDDERHCIPIAKIKDSTHWDFKTLTNYGMNPNSVLYSLETIIEEYSVPQNKDEEKKLLLELINMILGVNNAT